jgi:hypothetical protein
MEETKTKPAAPSRHRLMRAVAALALGFALIESSLWLLHFTVGQKQRQSEGGVAEILCIGDSHTYGWNVDGPSTWPAKLTEYSGVATSNRGAPGKNTATLIEELDEYLALDKPRLVLILGGLNNPWSRPHAGGEANPPNSVSWSRTVRLIQILVSRFESKEAGLVAKRIRESEASTPARGTFTETELAGDLTEVRVVTRAGDLETFVIGGGTLSTLETQVAYDWITRDLVSLVETVREAGATPVLLTYALEEGEYIPSVNFTIREAAVQCGALLIDVAKELAPTVKEFTAERLFFKDAHPRREGYELVASVIRDGLIRAGLLDGEIKGDPGALLRGHVPPEPRLALVVDPGADGALTLELAFEPALSYNLLLSRSLGPPEGEDWLGVPVTMARDELFRASERMSQLGGDFNPEGRARLEITANLASELGLSEGEIWASLAVRTKDWTVLGVSTPIRLR